MKRLSLLALRVSLGWLLVLWGLDKLVNVQHSVRVADNFYLGIGSAVWFLNAFGVLEAVIGLLIVAGLWRRWTYPAMLAMLAITGVSVWKSILDPWGWVLDGGNVLFYPSLIILAGALVVWAFRAEDAFCLDARRAGLRQPHLAEGPTRGRVV